MKRLSHIRPGYDCTRHPCGRGNCGKTAGGNHGIHGDEWCYFIVDGDAALGLIVYTSDYPASVPAGVYRHEKHSRGSDLSLHVSFPTEREQIAHGSTGNECDLLSTGRCFVVYSGCLVADEFFEKHGHDSFEQPESFWLALETRFIELAKEYRAQRVDTKYERCAHCDGTGTVRK